MFEDLTDITFLAAFRYKAKDSGHFYTPENYFLFKIDGSVRYFYHGKTFVSYAGDVLFFPKGIDFRTEMIIPGEYVLIYFRCPKDLGSEILHYPGNGRRDLSKLFMSAASLWSVSDEAAFFLCQSKLYEIIGRLAEDAKISVLPLSERKIIAAPVEYMKAHLYDADFSLTHMYELSGVSDTHFRKVFSKMYGMPPKRYVLTSRISHAANLLISDPTLQVQEVAEAVGYTDVFHFSKVFKKEIGMSPKTYCQQYIN